MDFVWNRIPVPSPEWRHLYPHFTVHICGQKRSLHIASFEFAAILGGQSEHSADSHGLGNRSKRVVEVCTFFHELSTNDYSRFELLRFEILFFDRFSTMLDFEYPPSRNGFGTRT